MVDAPPAETPRRRPICRTLASTVKMAKLPSMKSAAVSKATPRFTRDLDSPTCPGKQCPEAGSGVARKGGGIDCICSPTRSIGSPAG